MDNMKNAKTRILNEFINNSKLIYVKNVYNAQRYHDCEIN